MSNVATIENARPQLIAGGRPAAIVPQTMDEAYRMAKAVCLAGMAPKGMDTPEKAMIAIMRGLEVGLTPFQALDKIAVVNGRPTIWGDGAIGLVRGSGICEWIRERIDGSGDNRTAVCEAKRKGDPEIIKRSFSVADAKRAGLWGKAGPWQQYSERMLQMRARAFALRDGFADVLGGLYLREELEDGQPSFTPPAPPAVSPPPPPPERVAIAPPAPPPPPPDARADDEPVDYETLRKQFIEAANAADTYEVLEETWARIVEPRYDALMPPDQEDIVGIHRKRSRELEP